jgi:hypothetical protein
VTRSPGADAILSIEATLKEALAAACHIGKNVGDARTYS